jgi:glyoxylase-like metal-dependent hydrolase (beta-lactamase superfamily II)
VEIAGDGSVVIVPEPGHTPDSIVIFVSLPSGVRYAFVGDLAWQMEGLDIPAEKAWMLRQLIGENDSEVRQGIAVIRAAIHAYPYIRAVPAHDASAFSAMPVVPASH